MRYYEPKTAVLAHLPHIHTARESMGVSSSKYSDALILAIIHRETGGTGQPDAHRPRSQFYTHLQIGPSYLEDAGAHDEQFVGLTAKGINGDLDIPVRVFIAYMEKYAHVHDYRPSWIAALHKCGIGSMLKIQSWLRARKIRSLEHGLEVLDVANDSEYVQSWGKLFTTYAIWVSDENKSVGGDKRSKKYLAGYKDWPADWKPEPEDRSTKDEQEDKFSVEEADR